MPAAWRARPSRCTGAGTFQPVKTETLAEHVMHREWLPRAPGHAGRHRRLPRAAGAWWPWARPRCARWSWAHSGQADGDTGIFITPGFRFRVVDALVTNFHLPRSTLMMLVSAFAGHAHVMALYRHAVAARYRFFSYGDAMWLVRPG
jgi:S-adenosylmethionine:tRNA ribosyltransferase-isomerase